MDAKFTGELHKHDKVHVMFDANSRVQAMLRTVNEGFEAATKSSFQAANFIFNGKHPTVIDALRVAFDPAYKLPEPDGICVCPGCCHMTSITLRNLADVFDDLAHLQGEHVGEK